MRKIIKYDKEREIKFDFNSFCDFEKVSGVSFTHLDIDNLGLFEIRVLLWAGLKHEDPKLTTADAGIIIQNTVTAPESKQTLVTICADLSEAIKLSGVFQTPGEKPAGTR